jgi:predicted membrane protein
MPVALHNVSVAMYNFSVFSYVSCQCQMVFQLYIHFITFFKLSRITSRISNRQLLLSLLLLMCPAIGLSVLHNRCFKSVPLPRQKRDSLQVTKHSWRSFVRHNHATLQLYQNMYLGLCISLYLCRCLWCPLQSA